MPLFDHWWNCRGEEVEPFNERRGGQSGVERFNDPELGAVYIKKQVGHTFRSLRYPLGRPTAIRERDAYQTFARLGLKTPELVFVEARKYQGNWQAILVSKSLEGFTDINNWYLAGGKLRLGAETYQHFLQQLGDTLGKLHRQRWCHGSLNFTHIFLTPGNVGQLPEIAFIDLEKVRRMLTPNFAARHDLRTLRRRTPVVDGAALMSAQDWSILLDAHQKSLLSTS